MTQSILLGLPSNFFQIIISIGGRRHHAESPDLNPIENLWHELKEFIRREVKPRTKEELIDGIKAFWRTVTKEKCTRYILYCNTSDNTCVMKIIFLRYIRHLAKVIPKVLELNGEPTGY